TGPVLLAEFLPESVRIRGANGKDTGPAEALAEGLVNERLHLGSQNLYAEALELMERTLILRVLEHTQGNQLQAAKILGITPGSLRFKIRALGITIGRSVSADDERDG